MMAGTVQVDFILTRSTAALDDLAGMMRAVGHPTRLLVVAKLGERGRLSPSELAGGLAESLGNISYHVRELLKAEVVALVDTQPRRGAVEHYYELTERGRQVLAGVERFLEVA
jgi:DNA-binding transcriptional ArsR family regulator